MTNLRETFATMTHRDFTWPYPKPLIVRPTQPPMSTGIRLYMPKVDPNDCRCDAHGFQSDMNRYKQLADKERRLHDDVVAVNREMTNLMSTILENVCEMGDETMKSVYQTDYEKRGLPIAHYRQLMAAVDSPIGAPINPVVTDLRDGYRDPTRFRYSAINRPTIQPAKSINFLTVPETFDMWNEPFTGRSEYMDNFSKMGLSNMKNRQQYLEPLPSSRRRYGDCKM
ncbi:uncharacterized protein LOC124181360 [Neodiprion fabricii]|uniref:uncharacterized protein LOC124181360 n=1 Tax=Neodiprion fabricii TaxID=2872261 RepID=UPI001ED97FDB|nr:uncharacterized protein LOC124181360 [Neodiprion fabricii]